MDHFNNGIAEALEQEHLKREALSDQLKRELQEKKRIDALLKNYDHKIDMIDFEITSKMGLKALMISHFRNTETNYLAMLKQHMDLARQMEKDYQYQEW